MTSTIPTIAAKRPWADRLPIISHYRMSAGLQRGMLVAGLVLSLVFVLAAALAPVLAPFGFAQISDAAGDFPTQAAPGGKFLWGTTVGGFDVFSRTLWGAQTALLVIVIAVVCSIFLGVFRGLVSATSAAGLTASWWCWPTPSTPSRRCCWPS